MNIKIDDAIVVFDESHNIEYVCREAASFKIDSSEIDKLIESINMTLSEALDDSIKWFIRTFIKTKLNLLKKGLMGLTFDSSNNIDGETEFVTKKVFSLFGMGSFLNSIYLGQNDWASLKESLNILKIGDAEDLGIIDKNYISSNQLISTIEFRYNPCWDRSLIFR